MKSLYLWGRTESPPLLLLLCLSGYYDVKLTDLIHTQVVPNAMLAGSTARGWIAPCRTAFCHAEEGCPNQPSALKPQAPTHLPLAMNQCRQVLGTVTP
ncbi:hypothetical protein NDU88_006100 [Pleurodeles waltl]|uniref:Secreted protein n=1 Tax=Pleurodeles waltl TaxID=8319 RepID=A0AAV7QHR8_PLEWA|nr:hypothetical protein NDU88_006100 [Pleurodeles waltl]